MNRHPSRNNYRYSRYRYHPVQDRYSRREQNDERRESTDYRPYSSHVRQREEGSPPRHGNSPLRKKFKNTHPLSPEDKRSQQTRCRVCLASERPDESQREPLFKMTYTPGEIEQRKTKRGSTLSVIDRRRFEREFNPEVLNMCSQHSMIYRQNPHIRQVFVNDRKFCQLGRALKFEDLVIGTDTPKASYKRRNGEVKTVDHWGQRKLLMSEIMFLTEYANHSNENRETTTVVYAGAAPGTHTNFLARELFPALKFVLVDPAPFDARPTDKIEIRNEYFTDEIADEFSKEKGDVLFISDIRSWNTSDKVSDCVRESYVQDDMKLQMKWHNIMKPKATMLKMRLPYQPGKTTYLKGTIYLPVWGGRTTTECRLVACSDETHEYDHGEYESTMFHFQTVIRTSYFDHDVDIETGLCHCFDCSAEIFILENYFRKVRGFKGSPFALTEEVSKLSEGLSKYISTSGRALHL